MKKIYAVLMLLLINQLSAYTQVYVPFPTTNAVWTERIGMGEQKSPEYACLGLKNEDSTINGHIYHSLYTSADTVFTASD